jgi:hypothetical protein
MSLEYIVVHFGYPAVVAGTGSVCLHRVPGETLP